MVTEIRRIGLSHLDRVAALERACFPHEFWSRSILRGVLGRRPGSLSLGAFHDRELVGCVSADTGDPPELHVISIGVAPGFRRRGVGSALLSRALHWGGMRGCRRARLEVREGSLGALSVYNRLGFRSECTLPGFYDDGGTAVCMERGMTPVPGVAGAAVRILDLLGGRVPRAGVVLGSGLGWLAAITEPGLSIPYASIPGMEGEHVKGHQGRLLLDHGGDTVYLMGRRHHYQGYDGDQVCLLPSALASMGVDSWLLTTSAGALHEGLRTGDAVVITDHVNLSGCTPASPACPAGSPYSPGLAAMALEKGASMAAPVLPGVFGCVSGPAYETGAEVTLLRESGVSVVSMSTAQEAMALAAQGCRVLGLALVTNEVEQGDSVGHTEVLKAQERVSVRQRNYLPELVKELVR